MLQVAQDLTDSIALTRLTTDYCGSIDGNVVLSEGQSVCFFVAGCSTTLVQTETSLQLLDRLP